MMDVCSHLPEQQLVAVHVHDMHTTMHTAAEPASYSSTERAS